MKVFEKFVKMIDKREQLVKSYFSNNLGIKESVDWYKKNICKIDKNLIFLARTILTNEQFEDISDVFNNEFLMNKYEEYKQGDVKYR